RSTSTTSNATSWLRSGYAPHAWTRRPSTTSGRRRSPKLVATTTVSFPADSRRDGNGDAREGRARDLGARPETHVCAPGEAWERGKRCDRDLGNLSTEPSG